MGKISGATHPKTTVRTVVREELEVNHMQPQGLYQQPGRTRAGRFAPGNRLAQRPHANTLQMSEFRQALLKTLSAEIIQQAVVRLVELVSQGNLAAIRLLLAYGVGKPTAAVELPGPVVEACGTGDGGPLHDVLLETLVPFPEAFQTVIETMGAPSWAVTDGGACCRSGRP